MILLSNSANDPPPPSAVLDLCLWLIWTWGETVWRAWHMLVPWSTLAAPWWSFSWRKILGTVAVRQCSSSSGWLRSPTRRLSGMLPANTPSTSIGKTCGKSLARNCVQTCRIKSSKGSGVVRQRDRSPSTWPPTLKPTPILGESGPRNPPPWCTVPARTHTLPPLRHPLPRRSVKTGRSTWDPPKGRGLLERPPPLAVWCPTLLLATKPALPSPSSAPWAALAACTSPTWASPSTAKRAASTMCPSSRPALSTAASSTWAGI